MSEKLTEEIPMDKRVQTYKKNQEEYDKHRTHLEHAQKLEEHAEKITEHTEKLGNVEKKIAEQNDDHSKNITEHIEKIANLEDTIEAKNKEHSKKITEHAQTIIEQSKKITNLEQKIEEKDQDHAQTITNHVKKIANLEKHIAEKDKHAKKITEHEETITEHTKTIDSLENTSAEKDNVNLKKVAEKESKNTRKITVVYRVGEYIEGLNDCGKWYFGKLTSLDPLKFRPFNIGVSHPIHSDKMRKLINPKYKIGDYKTNHSVHSRKGVKLTTDLVGKIEKNKIVKVTEIAYLYDSNGEEKGRWRAKTDKNDWVTIENEKKGIHYMFNVLKNMSS